jgi:hypothetical protein
MARYLTADEIRRAIYKLDMENPANRADEIIVLLREIAYQLAIQNEANSDRCSPPKDRSAMRLSR